VRSKISWEFKKQTFAHGNLELSFLTSFFENPSFHFVDPRWARLGRRPKSPPHPCHSEQREESLMGQQASAKDHSVNHAPGNMQILRRWLRMTKRDFLCLPFPFISHVGRGWAAAPNPTALARTV